MKTENKKIKDFQVMAKLTLDISIPVSAKTIEEAVEKSKVLDEHDFVEILGEYMDGNYEITGVYS